MRTIDQNVLDITYEKFAELINGRVGNSPTTAEVTKALRSPARGGPQTVLRRLAILAAAGKIVKAGKGGRAHYRLVGAAYAVPHNILENIPFSAMAWVYIEGDWQVESVGAYQALYRFTMDKATERGQDYFAYFGNAVVAVAHILTGKVRVEKERTCLVSSREDIILAGTAAGIAVYPPQWVVKNE